ncbi:MAG: DUF3473 domain-containing protein [Pirellulales bacterium]|nr:DUF3473 domain-containing protein [Pirellulales bacterium]
MPSISTAPLPQVSPMEHSPLSSERLSMPAPCDATPPHLLTIALEDYFQVGAFRQCIERAHWRRFESRLEAATERLLALLDQHRAHATFFVSGWIAETRANLVREIARRGHEIAASGYEHASLRQLTRREFVDDAARGRDAVESASGRRALGFRVADQWIRPRDAWALDSLAELGFAYDSSLMPPLFGRIDPIQQTIHKKQSGEKSLWIVPVATAPWLGGRLPIGGGGYARQLPLRYLKRALRAWRQTTGAPLVTYFHAWEFDAAPPQIEAASHLARARHYRNLQRTPELVAELLGQHRTISIAEHLRLETREPAEPSSEEGRNSSPQRAELAVNNVRNAGAAAEPTPITIIVPCCNEEASLSYLAVALSELEADLAPRYEAQFVLVDDGSRDATWTRMLDLFGGWPNARRLRHSANQGVSAAILTGIRAADTEIVCSLDCDCTYDPRGLCELVPLLTDDVALVTASPYHPAGGVRNVPGWRLGLSKCASWLYRRALTNKLHTYTSCFRVYRRSAVLDLPLTEPGFLGVAELLALLDLGDARIVEAPAVLHSRLFGQSKMKTARTITAHLRLLSRIWRLRMSRRAPRKYTNSSPQTSSTSSPPALHP